MMILTFEEIKNELLFVLSYRFTKHRENYMSIITEENKV